MGIACAKSGLTPATGSPIFMNSSDTRRPCSLGSKSGSFIAERSTSLNPATESGISHSPRQLPAKPGGKRLRVEDGADADALLDLGLGKDDGEGEGQT